MANQRGTMESRMFRYANGCPSNTNTQCIESAYAVRYRKMLLMSDKLLALYVESIRTVFIQIRFLLWQEESVCFRASFVLLDGRFSKDTALSCPAVNKTHHLLQLFVHIILLCEINWCSKCRNANKSSIVISKLIFSKTIDPIVIFFGLNCW